MDITSLIGESYSSHLFNKADMMKIPLLGTFELTPICNMNCEMCYIRQSCEQANEKGGLKDVTFWNNVIDQAINEGMIFCLLTGGEILTYPGFKGLYEKLCKKGISIVLNTNGTMLNEETVSWMAQFPPRRLNISLYGASNETYESLCHLKDGFDRVIQGLDLLQKYDIPFRINGVLVPQNVKDYEGIKEICNKYGVKLQLSYYMFPPVRKELEHMEVKARFEPEEMAQIALMYRKEQSLSMGSWQEFVDEKCDLIEHPEKQSIYGVKCVTCRAGCSSFWVNWKGEISGCGIEDTHFYSLKEYSLKDAWSKLVNDTENIVLSENCSICRFRSICPVCMAAMYCETGKLDGTPEYLCQFSEKYAKLLFEERERLNSKR